MKVWEKIKQSAEEEGIRFTDCKDVRDWMYMHRVKPCDIEEEWEYIPANQLDELCDKYIVDCEKCLDAYLEIESESEDKI